MLRALATGGRTLAATALLWLGTAELVRAETIADALVDGYEASGLLDQNRALLRAADEDVALAVGALRPVVSWSASAQLTSPRQFGVDRLADQITQSLQIAAEITLYDGGANRLAVEVQKELVLATRASLQGVEQDVLQRIVQAYMEVRRNTEFVTLRQNNLRLITQELRAAQDRFEVGEVTRTDVSLAEARLAAARSLLASEQGGLAQANAEFRAAVGRPPGVLSPAAPVAVAASPDAARAIAVRTHPAIAEAQHNVTASELNIDRARATLRPTIDLQGSVSTDLNGTDSATIGIGVGGPIYQGGRLASQLRQFQAQRDAARAALYTTVIGVEQQVANAWTLLEVARASAVALRAQVEAADVAFRSVREEATLGARTTLDVLNAEQELLDARANLVSAQVDETIATYALLAAMGLLTAEHLGLNVQMYDPAAYYNLVRDAPAGLSSRGRALDRVLESIGD